MHPEQLIGRGEQLLSTGRWQEAEQVFRQALESALQIGDVRCQTIALANLGSLFMLSGEMAKASTLHRQALALAERSGDRLLVGLIYNGMGLACQMIGSYSQAIDYFEESQHCGAVWPSAGSGYDLRQPGCCLRDAW